MRKKIISIEQDFEKIKIYVTGKDNFLHTRVIETDVYDLAELLINKNNVMSEKKVYILQKPTIKSLGLNECIVKAGTEVTQREAIYISADGWCFSRQFVETSPEWFLPKEEEKPTIVTHSTSSKEYAFSLSNGTVISITKERLVELLFEEHDKNCVIGNITFPPSAKGNTDESVFSIVDKKIYSQKEYLQFGEECFNQRLLCKSETAANVLRYLIEDTDGFFKYESFSDFMNSKNKQAF